MKHPRGKRYDPEFKLRLAKEFVETDKTLEEIAQENGISSKTLNNWTVKYRKEGEAAFFKASRSGSFIRDPNKIPPVLYKELGLDKIRENPSELKGSFTEKEKLLLEIAEYKLQVKILKEALKKKERSRITDRFLANDYIGLGFTVEFVLLVLSYPKSSYHYQKKVRVILVGKPPNRTRGFCNKVDGTMITDIELEEILLEIFYFNDPYDPRYYLKVLGSKKLSKYLLNEMGIIVNHKKLHRLRKKLRIVRKYYTRHTHPVRRSTVHRLNRPGILWEADIKVISTITEGNIALLDIIDVYSREIVGSFIGNSCKSGDVISLFKEAILYQESLPQVVRTDNGTQFKANAVRRFFEKLNIIQEFGYRHNPDSQAHIESQHSNVQREFVFLNHFEDSQDVLGKYKVYMDFYHNLRPHAALNYLTPKAFKELNDETPIQIVKP